MPYSSDIGLLLDVEHVGNLRLRVIVHEPKLFQAFGKTKLSCTYLAYYSVWLYCVVIQWFAVKNTEEKEKFMKKTITILVTCAILAIVCLSPVARNGAT